jgi:hypothetical protein
MALGGLACAHKQCGDMLGVARLGREFFFSAWIETTAPHSRLADSNFAPSDLFPEHNK